MDRGRRNRDRPKGDRNDKQRWEMSRGTNHWSTRSTNNPQGRFCGFHFVFIVRHWPSAESAKPNVADHQIKRFYLCILEGIKHSVTEKVSDTPQAPVCAVNLCYPLAFAYILLHSCFSMLSSNTVTLYFLWSFCLSSTRCHTQRLGCLTAVSSPHPPPSCMSEGRQQVFCDSKIREPRRDGAPLSSAACVGGGEQIHASIFRVCPLSATGESTYPTPGWQEHRFNIPVCVCLIHVTRSCLSPTTGWVKSCFFCCFF